MPPSNQSNVIFGGENICRASMRAIRKHLEMPMTSAGGLSCFIMLHEPHVYFTHPSQSNDVSDGQDSKAIIRGTLRLIVTESIKVKAVTLTFCGKTRVEALTGSGHYLEEKLRRQVLLFYSALRDSSENDYGVQCNYALHNISASSLEMAVPLLERHGPNNATQLIASSQFQTVVGTNGSNRRPLQNMQPCSAKRDKLPMVSSTSHQNGYKVFPPGTYEYSFEILFDDRCPETIKLPNGSVRWVLEAVVKRGGAFKSDIHATKEVLVVCAPDTNSLEYIQPIPVRKTWNDQLHYDIVISGKSFPIGARIPIAFKLTPLTKVRCHSIKVYITEHINYLASSKEGIRTGGDRKVLLFERIAGRPLAGEYAASEFKLLSGGEMPREVREETRERLQKRREEEARRLCQPVSDSPRLADNLLGDLDLGLEHLTCQTEIEMEVQLPTCAQIREDRTKSIHPDTSWRHIQVNHWIKIVMQLSKADEEVGPSTGCQISVDVPLRVLSCLATQMRTSLPEYLDQNIPHLGRTYQCGCPDASAIDDISRSPSLGCTPALDSTSYSQLRHATHSLATAPQAHLSTHGANVRRPIHMLRNPSFDPPGFDAEGASPALTSPPPAYDMVIGMASHESLADYFARR